MSGPRAWPERVPERLEYRLVIEPDGTVVARSGKVEYGQGIRTGFARIVALELDVPIDRIRVELGETDRAPWDMGTFGSLSTATDGKAIRAAAAYARKLLLERASARLDIPVSELETRDGRVVSRTGQACTYQELVSDQPLSGLVPEGWSGRPDAAPAADIPMRLEARDIVTGRARYAADVRLPGMLRGRVLHPPVLGAEASQVDDAAARSQKGVVAILHDRDFVAAVAERDEQAEAAIAALKVTWRDPAHSAVEPVELSLRDDADVDAALAAGSAARTLGASYHVAPIAHASIGPAAAVADVREDGADLYVAAQRPFGLRDEAAEILGLSPERVHVHPQAMSGVYGRGNVNDAALDALRLSRAVRRPVLVQWSREDEFHLSPHRPYLDATIDATLSTEGNVLAWRYRARTNPHTYGGGLDSPRLLAMSCGRNAIPPYRLPRARIALRVEPAKSRAGAFRSLAAAPHVFAIESFVDELARAAGKDPLDFRLQQIDDPRLRRALETVALESNWRGRPRAPGRGFGMACAVYNGTAVAQVVEVVAEVGGRPRVEQVWCTVDAGRLVHSDGARNQIEGGIQQAASWALLEELRIGERGDVLDSTWHDYPIATFTDAVGKINVIFTSEPGAESTGVGEPGSVPTAAAIANAMFEATGVRVREVPVLKVRSER